MQHVAGLTLFDVYYLNAIQVRKARYDDDFEAAALDAQAALKIRAQVDAELTTAGALDAAELPHRHDWTLDADREEFVCKRCGKLKAAVESS